MSLARKISLLFGTAVLLTISATLTFPWLQMTALNEQSMLLQAKRVASAAYMAVKLQQPDWAAEQAQLQRAWPTLAAALDLPPAVPALVRGVPEERRGDGFVSEAIDRLARNPEQTYYWSIHDGGRVFRFAMAVRATDADPYPQLLRGIIDVRLAMPRERDVWNVVVTVLAGASGAVLAIMVFYLVSQRLVLTPVESLRQVAEKVTRGDIAVRSTIISGDEFEDLSDAFNDMLAHLRAAQEEQRKINRSLDVRLGELAETNVALYESNRLKSEFLTNVSHELRTPLVSIIGFAELLRDAWDSGTTDLKRTTRYTQNILTSGRSLLEIINDLLDLAKIEAGQLELHITEFTIARLGEDLVDFVRPLADKRNQKLELHLAPVLPRLRSDSGKIKQILYNLLSNAIKFTPDGGSVSLGIDPLGQESVRMIVTDTGPGIPEDQREAVFQKFRQLDASKTREHEGTGLGLAITRELVKILRGSIRLESEAGKGTTFIVDLPIAAPDGCRKKKPVETAESTS